MEEKAINYFREPIIRGPFVALLCSAESRRRFVKRAIQLGVILSIVFSFAIYFATRDHGYWAGLKILVIWLSCGFLMGLIEMLFRTREIGFANQVLTVKQSYHTDSECVNIQNPVVASPATQGLTQFTFWLEKKKRFRLPFEKGWRRIDSTVARLDLCNRVSSVNSICMH